MGSRPLIAGTVGFAVAFFLAGLLGDLLLLGFFLAPAVGGAALAWADGRRAIWRRSLFAGLAGGVGFVLAYFIVLAVWDPGALLPHLGAAFIGALGGGATGLGLALAQPGRDRRALVLLVAAGAVGFAVGFTALDLMRDLSSADSCCTPAQSLFNGLKLGLSGAIGGALLGVTIGELGGRSDANRARPLARV